MLTATSTPVPEPSTSNQNRPQSSQAIQKGADLLLELFNEERSQPTLIYRENEESFNHFKAQAEARIAVADSQLTKKTALLEILFIQHDKSVRDLEFTRNELQHVKAEHAKLMASIEEVGLVYMNGTLHFNDTTAKIVSDFRKDAQILDMVISHINSNVDTAPLPPDHNSAEALSNAIKPSDFFLFLSGILDGQYAHALKAHRQSPSASPSEGKNMTMNDSTLDDPESEQDSSLVWPGTYLLPTVSSRHAN